MNRLNYNIRLSLVIDIFYKKNYFLLQIKKT